MYHLNMVDIRILLDKRKIKIQFPKNETFKAHSNKFFSTCFLMDNENKYICFCFKFFSKFFEFRINFE